MNPQEQLKNLRARIHGQETNKENLVDNDKAIVNLHHLFMRQYGWIPINEFGNLPIPTLWNLLECIKKDKEAEEKEYKKMERKGRVGRR